MPSSPHRKAPGLAGVLALPGGKGGGGGKQHAARRQQERNQSAAFPLKSRELRGSMRIGCTFGDKYRALWKQLKRDCASAEKLKYCQSTYQEFCYQRGVFSLRLQIS